VLEPLADAIRQSPGPLLVVTGAGISLASGIPTFRGADPGAIWSADVTEMGTRRFFERDPAGSWRWYLQRFDGLQGKAPNPAHAALVGLERWKCGPEGHNAFLLVTQNIDGLHHAAGTERLVEVHGAARYVRCSRVGCQHAAPRGLLPREQFDFGPFTADPVAENLPRCPSCSAFLRPHVLWFDETYGEHESYRFGAVAGASRRATVLLFVGTSFSVGVTAGLLETSAARGMSTWSIDPSGERPAAHVQPIAAKAEEALPALVAALG
jgi:NAD-dependent deacetylase